MERGIVIPAALFTGEPVEKKVVMNPDEVERGEDAAVVWFMLRPVTSEWDAEYQEKRGQDETTLSIRRKDKKDRKEDDPEVELEPISKTFSNRRELKAMTWLGKKVIAGWRPIEMDNGQKLEFSGKNRDMMCGVPEFVRPAIAAAYELGEIKTDAEEGNSEISSPGSSNPNTDPDGETTGLTVVSKASDPS